MSYFLYLKQSFRRRPMWHLNIYVIITCALILPLLFSIYLDSSSYGWSQQLISMAKGETFHIANAGEKDVEVFRNIEGLSEPYWEDGTVYVHILDDEQWKNTETMQYFGSLLQKRLQTADNTMLHITAYDYDTAHGISHDAQEAGGQVIIRILSVFIMFISAGIMKSAYENHLRRFQSDMAILSSCGADNRQINRLYFAEFAVLFFCTAISAVLIAAGTMKLLFHFYLEVKEGQGIAWLIFKIEPVHTILCIAVFGLILSGTLGHVLKEKKEKSVWSRMKEDIQAADSRKRTKWKLSFLSSPEKSLTAIWKQRTNREYRSCIAVAVPVMTIFLFLFGYLSLDIAMMEKPQEYELWIYKQISVYGGFTQGELDFLNRLDNVESTGCVQESGKDSFAVNAGTDNLYVDLVKVKLHDAGEHKNTAEKIENYFQKGSISLLDRQEEVERAQVMNKGIYLLLMFLFAVLFLFMMLIIYMRLSSYIWDSRKTTRILSLIGATKNMVYASFIRQGLENAMAAVLIPPVVSILLVIVTTASTGMGLPFSITLVLTYLICGIMTVSTFVLPVYRQLKKQLKNYR